MVGVYREHDEDPDSDRYACSIVSLGKVGKVES